MSTEVRETTPDEAFEKMRNEGAVYLDVRTPEEFDEGHPQGAKNVPVLNSIDGERIPNENFVDEVKHILSVDDKIVVGCRTGGRSHKGCELLLEAGFKDVSNVMGGFVGTPHAAGWSSLNLPVE